MIGLFFYFILFFPKLQVSNVKISGNENIKSEDIEKVFWSSVDRKILDRGILKIYSRSIFFVDLKKASAKIQKNFPSIEKVKTQKYFPDTIGLIAQERKMFAVFCQQDEKNCLLIDKNGFVFEPLKSIPENETILFEQANSRTVFAGERAVGKDIMDAILKIKDNLKNNFRVDVKKVFISNPLVLSTSENWEVYFSLDSDINFQIVKMNSLLENEITEKDRKNLQYIYLHYKDRTYYK